MSNIIRMFWARPLQTYPALQRLWVVAGRFLMALGNDLARGDINLRAMSLVYTTLLSLAPLLAFSFSLLKGFGVHSELEPLLLGVLEPLGDKSAEITSQIVGFVENIKVGVLGAVGLGLLLYTVYSLMHKVTLAIDFTWNDNRGQRATKRLGSYFALLILGPFLLFALAGAMTGAVQSTFAQKLLRIDLVGLAFQIVLRWMPFVVIASVIALTYVIVPAARVRWWAALIGGIAASLMWKVLGLAFAAFVVTSTKYTLIYSAFATLLLLLIWLHLSWLTYLLGSRIAYYVQNPDGMRLGELAGEHSRELAALLVLREVIRGFYSEPGGISVNQLRRQLDLAPPVFEQSVACLEALGFIVRTQAEEPRYLPGQPPEQVLLADVLGRIYHLDSGEGREPPEDISNILSELQTSMNLRFGETSLHSAFVDSDVFANGGTERNDLSLK